MRALPRREGTPPPGLVQFERAVRGRGERRYALPQKRTALRQHTERLGGVKAKNSSRILSPSRSLSLSHLVVVIHHGISKPFEAPAWK